MQLGMIESEHKKQTSVKVPDTKLQWVLNTLHIRYSVQVETLFCVRNSKTSK